MKRDFNRSVIMNQAHRRRRVAASARVLLNQKLTPETAPTRLVLELTCCFIAKAANCSRLEIPSLSKIFVR